MFNTTIMKLTDEETTSFPAPSCNNVTFFRLSDTTVLPLVIEMERCMSV